MIMETTVLCVERDVPRIDINGDRFLLSIPSIQLAKKFDAKNLIPDLKPFLCYDFKDGDFIYRQMDGTRVTQPQTYCQYRPMLVPLKRGKNEVDNGFGLDNADGTVLSGGYLRLIGSSSVELPFCYGNRDRYPGCIAPNIKPGTLSFIPYMGDDDQLADPSMEPLKWIVFNGVLICANYLFTKFGSLRETNLIPPSYGYKQRKERQARWKNN